MQFKSSLLQPPILSTTKPGEELYLYLVVSYILVNTVLIREEEGAQKPIFFTTRTLSDPETRYFAAGKLVLALITTRKYVIDDGK